MRIRLPDPRELAALALFVFTAFLFASLSFAGPSPSPSGLPILVEKMAAQNAVSGPDFLTAVTQAMVSFGGASWALKVTMIVMLLIASMKVTALDNILWGRLGKFQAFAAPVLGLLGGLLTLGLQSHVTLPGLFAYLGAGAGAILLHELLDALKGFPGLGTGYVAIITSIEGALGGNPVGTQDAQTAKALTGATPGPSA